MRRVLRHIFTLGSAASLLLTVAIGALWLLSYFNRCGVRRIEPTPAGDQVWAIEFPRGGVVVSHSGCVFPQPPARAPGQWEFRSNLQMVDPRTFLFHPERSRAGFGYESMHMILPEYWFNVMTVVIPCWFLLLLTTPLPLAAGWKIVRRRSRVAAGRCANCGYDLRASTGRCPECGAAIP